MAKARRPLEDHPASILVDRGHLEPGVEPRHCLDVAALALVGPPRPVLPGRLRAAITIVPPREERYDERRPAVGELARFGERNRLER